MFEENKKEKLALLIKKYEKILENNEINSYTEEDTKKDFILPFFEILGWDVKSEKERNVFAEKKISKGFVDYAFKIGIITKFLVEAKKLSVNVNDRKWQDQSINYTYNRGITWAIVTNFIKFKVFNAEVKMENLEVMKLLDLDYKDYLEQFDKILLFSKNSFLTNELDTYAESIFKKTKRTAVNERLFVDLTIYRDKLSKSILKFNKDESFSQNLLEEIILRIISRFIFIRTLEDKSYEDKILLPIVRAGNVHKNLRKEFERLNEIYNARLFEHHECDDIELGDGALADIINGLYHSDEQKQDYDFSIINADILGGIYEQYLTHILNLSKKEILPENATKKNKGIYYTPSYIIDYMLFHSFCILKENNADPHSLKILDPACGSGSFLTRCIDYLEVFSQNMSFSDIENSIMENPVSYSEKKAFLENSIFGVDQDKMAQGITQLNLYLKIATSNQKLPTVKHNILNKNSLVDDPLIVSDLALDWKKDFINNKDGQFDLIIGNPPYVRADTENIEFQKQRTWLNESDQYETLFEKWDLYIAFIERSLKLLKPNGVLCFIISNSFNTSKYSLKLKKFIKDNYCIKQIDFFRNVQIFKGVGVESVIILIQNKKQIETPIRILHENHFANLQFLESTLDDEKLYRITESFNFENNFKNCELLGNICYLSKCMVLNSDEKTAKNEFKKEDLISETQDDIHNQKYVEAENISAFRIKNIRFLEWNTERIPSQLSRATFPELYESPKIIRGRTTDAVLDESSNLLCNDGCIILKPFHLLKSVENKSISSIIKKTTDLTRDDLEQISKQFSLKYLMGIINSKLFRFYLNSIRRHRIEYYFYPDDLRKMPIKKPAKTQENLIISIVDQLNAVNLQLNLESSDKQADLRDRIDTLTNELNECIYDLYQFSDEEKLMIEQSFIS